MSTRKINIRFQQGMTIITLVFIIGLAATAFLLNALNANTVKIERDKKTAAALAEAKAALIGWSVNRTNPGQLPCPEDTSLIGLATEGQAKSSCTSLLPVIGRLPWRSLGVGDLRDGYDEKLWYVISPGFRASPINITTPAQLSVDGVAGSAVAIVFSPGPLLFGQSRPTPSAASPPDVTQYLDLSNNDGNASFVTSGAAGSYNDKLLLIRGADIFSIVALRVLGEVRGDGTQGMREYYDAYSNFPYADFTGDGNSDAGKLAGTPSFQGHPDSLFFNTATKNMLLNNGWFPLISYAVSADRQGASLTLNGKTLSIAP